MQVLLASPAPTTSTCRPRGRTCPRRHSASSSTAPRASPSPSLHRRPQVYEVKKPFEGVIGNLNRRMLQTESAWMREELSRYQSSRPCEVCHGARLKPEPLTSRSPARTSRSPRAAASPTPSLVRRPRSQARPPAPRDRPRHPQGNQRAPRLPPQCRARLSPPRPHQRHAVAAARASASASRRRSAAASRASSTSSTSPRSASTRRTTTASSKPLSA